MAENYINPKHTVVNADVANVQVLPRNELRRYAAFINDSDTTVYLSFGTPAVMNKGIRLNANGGMYEMFSGRGNLYKGDIYVISSVTGKSVLVTEGM
jgi:uncharacterized protein (DUF39 family)